MLFIIIPQQLTDELLSKICSILYFLMVTLLMFNAQLIYVGSIISSCAETFNQSSQNTTVLSIILCFLFCLLGLILSTPGGVYLFSYLMDFGLNYNYGLATLLAMIAVYIYGKYQ